MDSNQVIVLLNPIIAEERREQLKAAFPGFLQVFTTQIFYYVGIQLSDSYRKNGKLA